MALVVHRNLAPAAEPDFPVLAEMQRPFGREHLAPLPDGWRAGPPDWVLVGCGKAGSSWLHEQLAAHPDVVPNRVGVKELHYFCHFGFQGPDAAARGLYRQAFARPAGKVSGDASGDYLYYPLAIPWLHEAAPEARLVAILRNPVERCLSAYNQFLSRRAPAMGLTGRRGYVFETFSLLPEAVNACRIAHGLRQVLARWPRERLLVLQFERVRQDPLPELARLFRFLGLDDAFVPPAPGRAVNVLPYRFEKPEGERRARLAELFADDVEACLALLPELERELWTDFRSTPSPARPARASFSSR